MFLNSTQFLSFLQTVYHFFLIKECIILHARQIFFLKGSLGFYSKVSYKADYSTTTAEISPTFHDSKFHVRIVPFYLLTLQMSRFNIFADSSIFRNFCIPPPPPNIVEINP